MTDINDKYRERWQDRRQRSYNWKKLIIMALLLAALIILINRLNKVGSSLQQPAVEYNAADTTGQAQNPANPASGEAK